VVEGSWQKAASQGGFFNVMWHRPVWSIAAGCSSRADAVINFFVACITLVTCNAFRWARYSQKMPFRVGISTPMIPYLIHGSLGPPESVPKWHLDRFSRFCSAHKRDQQTDTQTDHATPIAVKWCKNVQSGVKMCLFAQSSIKKGATIIIVLKKSNRTRNMLLHYIAKGIFLTHKG